MANPAPAIRIESRKLAKKPTKRKASSTVTASQPRRRKLKIRG